MANMISDALLGMSAGMRGDMGYFNQKRILDAEEDQREMDLKARKMERAREQDAAYEKKIGEALISDILTSKKMLEGGASQGTIVNFWDERVESGKKMGRDMRHSSAYRNLAATGRMKELDNLLGSEINTLGVMGKLPGQGKKGKAGPLQTQIDTLKSQGYDDATIRKIIDIKTGITQGAGTQSPEQYAAMNKGVGDKVIDFATRKQMAPYQGKRNIDMRTLPGLEAAKERQKLGVQGALEPGIARDKAFAAKKGTQEAELGTKARIAGEVAAATAQGSKDVQTKASRKEEKRKKDQQLKTYNVVRKQLKESMSAITTGPVAGEVMALTQGQQVADQASEQMFQSIKELVRQKGEGTFTDSDAAQLKMLIPTRKMLPKARETALKNLDEWINAKIRMDDAPADGQAQKKHRVKF